MVDEKVSYKDVVDEIKPELDKAIAFLEKELQKIRTERASPSLVENIEADCFGKRFPLKQLATISVPKAREIVIQPWDKSYIEEIVKALEKNTSIGGTPVVDKDVIRIRLPSLSEEFRKELIRFTSEKQEVIKKTIRRWRDEAWRKIQDSEREGRMSEDDKFKGKDELQELIDEYSEKVEEMIENKKKEIEA